MSTLTVTRTIAVVGAECAGKSSLVATMTGRTPRVENWSGSSVAVEVTRQGGDWWVDTPGILAVADTDATRRALAALDGSDVVVLVVAAPFLDDDLPDLLPVVAGHRGVLVVTHGDRVGSVDPVALRALERTAGVPVVVVDARDGTAETTLRVDDAVARAGRFTASAFLPMAGWALQPPDSLLERPRWGPLLALVVMFAPLGAAVAAANLVAGRLDPLITDALAPLVAATEGGPPMLQAVLAGDYGLLTMGPLLVVWALPTVLLVAALLAVLKTSGVVDRLASALDPVVAGVGLHGRDLVRVVMGFGCNVPAVVATRSCSACTRDTAMAVIAFGAACSYQLSAAMAVFAAAGRWWLVWPYMGVLAVATLVHARWLSRRARAAGTAIAWPSRRAFLVLPRPRDVWRETRVVLDEFLRKALPVFVAVAVAAALVDHAGWVHRATATVEPLLAAVRLPADTAGPLVLSAIRKDGVLLLEASAASLSAGQLLTAMFVAGSLVPCLVTAATVARERGMRHAGRLVVQQAAVASSVAVGVAWAAAATGW